MRLVVLVARDGQAPSLELLDDELPPADGLLLVDRGLAALVDLHVGQAQLAVEHQLLVHLLGRRGADDDVEELRGVLNAGELGVGDEVARQLEDALVDLRKSGLVVVWR